MRENFNFKFSRICKLVIVISLIVGNWSLVISQPLNAADSSPSATANDDIKSKLKTLQEEIASRAAQMKQEVGQKLQNKAYIGFVKSESDNSLIIASDQGSKIINLNEYTEYASTTKVKGKAIKGVSAEDYIAALGDVDENDVLTAKKVVKLDPDTNNGKTITWGIVTAVGDNNLSIQTKDKNNLSLSWDNTTTVQDQKGRATTDQIDMNEPIIVVATKGKNDVLEASFIYIAGTQITPTIIASPSATVKPTK